MKTKDLLKRTYYALTMAGVMLLMFAMYSYQPLDRWYDAYFRVSFFALLSWGICWIMTRHNKPQHLKWYPGIMIAFSLWFIYAPHILGNIRFLYTEADTRQIVTLIVYTGCVAVSTFLSETKYHNILPNQSKGVSTLFRVVSWIGQIGIWIIVVAIGVDEVSRVVDKDYYKRQYEKIERVRAKRLQLHKDNH
jgi:hypothetical protein